MNNEPPSYARPVGAGDGCGTVTLDAGALVQKITALEAERERLRSALIGIVDHWWEFGEMVDGNDDYGFSERVDLAAKLVK